MPAGNQTLLKRNNQRAITNYIIEHGPISRADLSKRLKISKPTVSANVTELIEMNLLQEIGFCETDIGKKPMLVDFNKNVQYVLVLDFISYISRGKVPIAVCNLYCEPIFIDTIFLSPCFTGEEVRTVVTKTIRELFSQNKIVPEQVGKVVLTAPTVCYDENHVPLECRNHEFINLAELFQPDFAGKIAVKNDINLAAIGEKHFGVGKEADNLFFVWAGLAVGGGLILNGEIYEGYTLYGGELAFTTVYDTVLNKYMFLQDLTSMDGIRAYIAARKEAAAASSIAKHLLDDTFYLDMMIEAAAQGDTFCLDFARHVSQIFASVIANITYTMNLQMVIIGGEYTGFGSLLVDETRRILDSIPLPTPKVTTPFYTNSAMYGAFKFGAESIISGLI